MAILSNMEVNSRMHALASYLSAEFKENHNVILADLFEVSAMGALAAILKERAATLASKLGSGMGGGKGNAN